MSRPRALIFAIGGVQRRESPLAPLFRDAPTPLASVEVLETPSRRARTVRHVLAAGFLALGILAGLACGGRQAPGGSHRDWPSRWRSASPLPEARWLHRAGWGSDGRLYAVGGVVHVEYVTRSGNREWWSPLAYGEHAVVRLAPKAKAWQRVPAPRVAPKHEMRMTAVYYPGCGRYHVRCDHPGTFPSWFPNWVFGGGAPPPGPGDGDSSFPSGVASVNGRILWLGGMVVLDPATKDAWVQPSYVSDIPRGGHCDWNGPVFLRSNYTVAASPDGRLYRIGGMVHGPPQSTSKEPPVYRVSASVESYDPRTGCWSRHAPMRRARQLAAAAFGPDGKLYVFGGYGGMGSLRLTEADLRDPSRIDEQERLAAHALGSVEAYDPKTDRWEPRASMPQGLEWAGAALGADGRIYVIGGSPSFSDPRSLDRVWVYDPREDAWYDGPSLLQARLGHAVIADPEGRIWVSGGLVVPPSRGLVSVEVLDTRPFAAPGFLFPGRERRDPRAALGEDAKRLGAADAKARLAACQAVERLVLPRDTSLVAPLARAAADPSAALRACALKALARMHEGARRALPVVKARLRDEDATVRFAGVEAWLRVAPKSKRAQAIGPLLDFLRSDDDEARLHAIWGLERVGTPALAALRRALHDADRPFPVDVVEALEAFGTQAVPALLDALHDPRKPVREAAVDALDHLAPMVPDRAVPALFKALHDSRAPVREAAAGVLEASPPKTPERAEALAQSFDDESATVRYRVALALARMGEPARPALMAALRHARWDVRCSAAWALGELPPKKESIRALRALTKRRDADPTIVDFQQRAACEALLRLKAWDASVCPRYPWWKVGRPRGPHAWILPGPPRKRRDGVRERRERDGAPGTRPAIRAVPQ